MQYLFWVILGHQTQSQEFIITTVYYLFSTLLFALYSACRVPWLSSYNVTTSMNSIRSNMIETRPTIGSESDVLDFLMVDWTIDTNKVPSTIFWEELVVTWSELSTARAMKLDEAVSYGCSIEESKVFNWWLFPRFLIGNWEIINIQKCRRYIFYLIGQLSDSDIYDIWFEQFNIKLRHFTKSNISAAKTGRLDITDDLCMWCTPVTELKCS